MQEINKTDDLGLKIKNYLKDRGITQTWLAYQTGLGIKKINDIVNSSVKLSATDLGLICKALDVSADLFLA